MVTFSELGYQGRLGNQMFQIASTIGIAMKNNHQFIFPPWRNHLHAEQFESLENINIDDYYERVLPTYYTGKSFLRANEFVAKEVPWGYHDIQLEPGINYNLSGYMQSEKYFAHCKEKVRFYFSLADQPQSLDIPADAVAIHVRRGDYDDNYHPLLSAGYYAQALSALPPDRGPLFVFSDEPEKAKALIPNADKYVSGNHYMTDFFLMTKCTHFIIANSTFSWWAAWLGSASGKMVVAPKTWFGPAAGLDATDIYCEDWVIV